ncbi:hypothetical protein V4R08_16080 (plasmid) [Nitrobacter sp. NHB1]|uniref:ArsR/SmtB family transcription factor n=1 Tax=Nitrobacter sp. NHB1 TaxID=3119830 RepID=UPI002FFE876D
MRLTLRSAASGARELLKVLSTRLILFQLVNGEKSVGQFADFFGIRDSTASQHLAYYAGFLQGVLRWIKTDGQPQI